MKKPKDIFYTVSLLFFSLLMFSSAGRALEPVVTIRQQSHLPDIKTKFESELDKKIFKPKIRTRTDDKFDFLSVELKHVSLPETIDFNPTAKNRYWLFQGKVNVSFGEVYLGINQIMHYRDSVDENGQFTLGPITADRFQQLYLYYVYREDNVSVIHNDGTKIKPVQIRIESLDLRNGIQNNQSFAIDPQKTWKKKSLQYFKNFLDEIGQKPERNQGEYRIEYVRDAEKTRVRREGKHYILPFPE